MAEPLRTVEATRLEVVTPTTTTELQPTDNPVRQAYRTLHLGFTLLPIIAGMDKFFHLLVNWDDYLAPQISNTLGIAPHTFMLAVGVIEIIAGVGVAVKPKVFGYVVGLWMLGIVGNLLLTGTYYDIALRDFGLSLGAFALARLARVFDRVFVPNTLP